MKKTAFLLLIVSLCFMGCQSESNSVFSKLFKKEQTPNPPPIPPLNAENLCRGWYISGLVEMPDLAEKLKDVTFADYRTAVQAGIQSGGIWYHFFSDGTMCEMWLGLYRPGNWRYNSADSTLILQFGKKIKETIIFKITHFVGNDLKMTLNDGNISLPLRMQSPYTTAKNAAADPFHLTNNAWRFKPLRAETDEQLKARMGNHLQHYARLFEASIADSTRKVSFDYSPSCLQIYSSAIGLKKQKQIPEAWYFTYYNKAQADKAMAILQKIMRKKYSLGDTSGSWMQDNVEILQYLQSQLQGST